MKSKIIHAVLIAFAFSVNVSAQENLSPHPQSGYRLMELKANAEIRNTGAEGAVAADLNLKKSKKEKSPYIGALLSGLIPGAGEFYAESYIKAAVFFALEAGLWATYAIYENKGDDQTEEFENFADDNWSINRYAAWLKREGFTGSSEITDPNTSDLELLRMQVNSVERLNFSHQLPPFGDQQYYEVIGKYQNFVAGWADAPQELSKNQSSSFYYGTYKTDMFVSYSVDRQQANDYYDVANTSTTLVVVNHLLSAADAAWSVTMFNKNVRMKSNLRMQSALTKDLKRVTIPTVNLNVTF